MDTLLLFSEVHLDTIDGLFADYQKSLPEHHVSVLDHQQHLDEIDSLFNENQECITELDISCAYDRERLDEIDVFPPITKIFH
jgi:hypothetical protein